MKIINVYGFEGLYAVSDSGEIYNLKRGLELKKEISKHGYERVSLSKNGQKKHYSVHGVVYNSFNGKVYDDMVIDHINGSKTDNRLINLRKITTRHNTTRAKVNKTGFHGVHYYESLNKFGTDITIKGERYFLGLYGTAEEAHKKYIEARNNWDEKGIAPTKKDNMKKFCKGCARSLPKDNFYYTKGHGHSYLCKECQKAKMKEYRAKIVTE